MDTPSPNDVYFSDSASDETWRRVSTTSVDHVAQSVRRRRGQTETALSPRTSDFVRTSGRMSDSLFMRLKRPTRPARLPL